jgi:cytochrome oxidase Cu insertion factor (SCO1/SenC/PrrC family)
MNDTNNNSQDGSVDATRRRNRAQMISIMLVAFITLGGSYAIFYYAKTSGGWGTTNHGEFVSPATTTEQLGWQVEGDQRKWWLWVVASDCDAACQATVKHMQAVHKLLNREADRVRRGFTGVQGAYEPNWMSAYPGMAVVNVADPSNVKNGIYIVDPNGNLVLFYDLATEPKPVLEDLKKLLKVSQIG